MHLGPKTGDYFGLNVIGTIRAKRLFIHTRQRIRDPTNVFSVSVADSVDHWVTNGRHTRKHGVLTTATMYIRWNAGYP